MSAGVIWKGRRGGGEAREGMGVHKGSQTHPVRNPEWQNQLHTVDQSRYGYKMLWIGYFGKPKEIAVSRVYGNFLPVHHLRTHLNPSWSSSSNPREPTGTNEAHLSGILRIKSKLQMVRWMRPDGSSISEPSGVADMRR